MQINDSYEKRSHVMAVRAVLAVVSCPLPAFYFTAGTDQAPDSRDGYTCGLITLVYRTLRLVLSVSPPEFTVPSSQGRQRRHRVWLAQSSC